MIDADNPPQEHPELPTGTAPSTDLPVVFWDLGGVVVDVDHDRGAARWDALTGGKGPGLEACFFESGVKARLDDGRTTRADGLAEVVAASGHIDAEGAAEAFNAILSSRPPVSRLVNLIAEQTRCAVISNTDPIHGPWIEANVGIETAIETWVYSFDERAMKPEPPLYEAAMSRMGVEPGQSLLIDDRADNIETARALGMSAIRFTTLEAVLDGLRARGFRVS